MVFNPHPYPNPIFYLFFVIVIVIACEGDWLLCSHALDFFGEFFCNTYVGDDAPTLQYPFQGLVSWPK
jgi:hypothetical protein